MLRKLESKLCLQCFEKPVRLASTKVSKLSETKFHDEWNNAKPFESIPMLTKFQTIRSFLPRGKYHNKSMDDINKAMNAEYGNIAAFPAMFGRPQMLTTFNVEDVEKIFRFEGVNPYRRSMETLAHYRAKIRPDIYEEYGSLISEQDDEWHKMRTIVNPVMLMSETINHYVPQVDAVSKDFIRVIMKKRDVNSEVPADFNEMMNMWSLESIACLTLNTRLGLLNGKNDHEKAEKLVKLIRKFSMLTFEFEAKPTIWKYYETKSFKKLLGIYDDMTNIVLHYVDEAIENFKVKPSDELEDSILEKLIKINKKVGVVMCADALLAGVDTTSSAAVGILYCLAKYPDKQELLREELRKVLPDKDDDLTPDMIREMPYLRVVIKEGIRLYPPLSGTLRTIRKDLVLSGYRVPKGTEVSMSLVTFHRDEDQFEDASEFIPERWLKSNTDASCPHAKDAHPFAFIPFGFGARSCIGRRLAELEIEVLISRIIRDYRVEWKHKEIKFKSVLVNVPDCELKFKFTEV